METHVYGLSGIWSSSVIKRSGQNVLGPLFLGELKWLVYYKSFLTDTFVKFFFLSHLIKLTILLGAVH